ncbi:MAG: hypothetical protein KDB80_10380 [Planctomycetes bacterium]|nr:hypothetical protein [Planctomycetota bacterium]
MFRTLTHIALATALLGATAIADGRKPGSVLIYPVHRSGPEYFTVLCVTNTNTAPMTPTSLGGSTNLHFEYFNVVPNPDNPFLPLDCVVFDRVEYLTPADTLCVLTACHNATAGGGQEGWVKVTAQAPQVFDTDWCFDFLIGSEVVVNAYGAMYSVNADPIATIPNPVCLYEAQSGSGLLVDSYVAALNSSLALATNIPGNPYAIRHLLFSVWNDNETALSATLAFRCWFDQPLAAISPLFTEQFLRSVTNDPEELDINCDGIGDLETGWIKIDTTDVTLPGGAIGGGMMVQAFPILNIVVNGTTVARPIVQNRDFEVLSGIISSIEATNGARNLWITVTPQVLPPLP